MLARVSMIVASVCVIAAGLAVFVPVNTQAAAPTYFSTTTTVSGSGTAYCSSPWKLTGGGAGPLPGDAFYSTTSTEYALTGSYPSGSTWRATATITRGIYSTSTGWSFRTSSYSPRVYAICAR